MKIGNFEITEITDAWLINKETGERVLHLDQCDNFDTSWTSEDEFRFRFIKDKKFYAEIVGKIVNQEEEQIDIKDRKNEEI